MLNRIIRFSVRQKLIILLLTLFIVGFGIFSILNISLGAVPDVTNNQVQVITTSTNLSTQDVEQFITYPVELEMSNLPGVTEIRSISKFGLSVVTIVFEEKMGTYLPRQLIAEKIKSATSQIPEHFGTPEMGPISTGLGEIYQYTLDIQPGFEDLYSIMDLRTIHDWVVRRQLSGIPGVVEVNTWGGFLKQYEVSINPETLKGMGISLPEVFTALESNNDVAGGAYIEKQDQSYFIRGDGLIGSLDDLRNVVVKTVNGVPVLVKDIGEVRFGHATRYGAITANGEGETVLGQIMMLKDANSNKVIKAVKQRVDEVQESLPEGISINPIVDRSELIGRTSHTVFENLLLGCLIVFVVVVLLLGNLRSGLVIASIIPLSLLFTLSLMYIFGIDANLMSLGALDFGIIIDGAVIIVEFIAVRLTMNRDQLEAATGKEKQTLMDRITYDGASKMMNSAIFGQVIILIVFIPVLSLSGVEGKMFRPMALTFSFALLGAMFFGLTWLPVASSLFLKPESKKPFALTRWVMRIFYRSYDPVIRFSYDHKWVIFVLASASLLWAGLTFSRMGGEFVPTLDEGDFVIQPVLETGTSLSRTVEYTTRMEQILIDQFPEVEKIVCRIGAAEVPTDPMSMEEIDMIIKLRPKGTWTSASSKEELANRFKEALSVIPGVDYEFTQPIEMRFNELITGVRSDLAVKIFGEDLDVLADLAEETSGLIRDVPGAADVILEKTEGLPQMSVRYHRNMLALYGLSVAELNGYLTTAFGGAVAGSIFEGERRFDLVVRFQPGFRKDIGNLRNLPVLLPGGTYVPLRELADIQYTTGPAKISRDDTRRRVVVSVNVRNRDLESVVEDIDAILSRSLDLPPGYSIDYGGQFENLQNATRRLKLAVPIALLLIFIFLHFAFGSFKEAALIFTAVPLSAVGGVFLLWIRGMPFSISAGIGFIALFGVAVLNGIVLIEHLKELKKQGITDMRTRVLKGTRERLRPVLLTAAAAAMGFLPMAVSNSPGAEVQRPLATVVIGGLVTSTLLTMLALPLLYAVFDSITGIRIWPPGWKRNGAAAVLLLFLLPAVSHAQSGLTQESDSPGITLPGILELAYRNHPALRAGQLQVQEQEALKGTAFQTDRTSLYYNYDENNIAHNDHPIGVIGAEQRFDFPTVYGARKKSLEWSYQTSLHSLELEKRKLTVSVVSTWDRLQYARSRLDLYRRADSLYTILSAVSERSHSAGQIRQLDMLVAKSVSQEMQLRRKQAGKDAEIALSKLLSLVGGDTLLEVAGIVYEPLEEQLPDLSGDPGLMYLSSLRKKAEAEKKVEQQSLLPDLTISYFNGTNRFENARHYQGVELGLGVPLFFWDERARIKAREYASESFRYREEAYRLRWEQKVEELMKQLQSARESIQYFETAGRPLSRELVQSASLSFETGEVGYFEYLQSMERAWEIERAYLEQVHRYNQLVIQVNHLVLEPNYEAQ